MAFNTDWTNIFILSSSKIGCFVMLQKVLFLFPQNAMYGGTLKPNITFTQNWIYIKSFTTGSLKILDKEQRLIKGAKYKENSTSNHHRGRLHEEVHANYHVRLRSREKGDILEGQSPMYDNREKNNWHNGKVDRAIKAEDERTLLLFTSNGWKCTDCQDTAQLFFLFQEWIEMLIC